MAKQIQVNDDLHLETYEFVDKDKNVIFTVKFMPTDLDIARRYDEVVEWMNGINLDDNDKDALFKVSDELKEKINYLLGNECSKEIFARANPFTPLKSGKIYAESVMESIGKLIENEMNIRTKKLKSRIGKYTAKYHK